MQRTGTKSLLLGGLVTTTVLVTTISAGAATPESTWTAVPLNFEKGGLSAVAAVGESETWAVGSDIVSKRPVALRERAGKWEPVAPPSSLGHLYGVSGRGPEQVWVVGTSGTALFDGRQWREFAPEKVPQAKSTFADVSTAPDGQAWTVGTTADAAKTVGELQHWDPAQRTWKRQQIPVGDGDSTLEGISVRAADDVWAVGSNTTDGTAVAVHWDGMVWTKTPVPAVNGKAVQLQDVQHLSGDDVWAVGRVVTASGGSPADTPFLVHWDGQRWTAVDAPTEKGWPASISAVEGGLVAAGAEFDGELAEPYLLRYENGKWRRDEAPTFHPETGGISDVAGRGQALTAAGTINRGDPAGDVQPIAPYLGVTTGP